jgi:hypothetical protein
MSRNSLRGNLNIRYKNISSPPFFVPVYTPRQVRPVKITLVSK